MNYVNSLGLEDGGKAALSDEVQHLIIVDAVHRESKISRRGPKCHQQVIPSSRPQSQLFQSHYLCSCMNKLTHGHVMNYPTNDCLPGSNFRSWITNDYCPTQPPLLTEPLLEKRIHRLPKSIGSWLTSHDMSRAGKIANTCSVNHGSVRDKC